MKLDLECFKSKDNFIKEIKINILVNNGGLSSWENIYKTEDEYLNVCQVNYLGNALLTLLLLEHFNEKESKIISVSSMAYKGSK